MVKRPREIHYPKFVQLRLSEEVLASLDRVATERQTARSDLIRQLLIYGLNRIENGHL